MACVAVVCRVGMGGRFALRNNIVMATHAGTNDIPMINGVCLNRCPGCWARLMTGIAGICCVDMIARLTGCGCTIMTTKAGTDHFVMVDRTTLYRCPACREDLVTGVAGIGGIDVTTALAAGRCSVVAGKAIIHKTRVVYRRDL